VVDAVERLYRPHENALWVASGSGNNVEQQVSVNHVYEDGSSFFPHPPIKRGNLPSVSTGCWIVGAEVRFRFYDTRYKQFLWAVYNEKLPQ